MVRPGQVRYFNMAWFFGVWELNVEQDNTEIREGVAISLIMHNDKTSTS